MSVARSGRNGLALVSVLAAGALALGGCGSSGDASAGEPTEAGEITGVGRVVGGSTAQFADCKAWRRGTEEERYATIVDIRGGTSSDLPDEAAYAIFEKVCEASFSDSLRLYKLYDRALAFAPITSEPG